jgi:hypothetical protein
MAVAAAIQRHCRKVAGRNFAPGIQFSLAATPRPPARRDMLPAAKHGFLVRIWQRRVLSERPRNRTRGARGQHPFWPAMGLLRRSNEGGCCGLPRPPTAVSRSGWRSQGQARAGHGASRLRRPLLPRGTRPQPLDCQRARGNRHGLVAIRGTSSAGTPPPLARLAPLEWMGTSLLTVRWTTQTFCIRSGE